MRPPADALPQPAGDFTDVASSQSPGQPHATSAGASAPPAWGPGSCGQRHSCTDICLGRASPGAILPCCSDAPCAHFAACGPLCRPAFSRVVNQAFSTTASRWACCFWLPALVLLSLCGWHSPKIPGQVAAVLFGVYFAGQRHWALAFALLLCGECLFVPGQAIPPCHSADVSSPGSLPVAGLASSVAIAAGLATAARLVPTPCRARRSPPTVSRVLPAQSGWMRADWEVGPTLLEQSRLQIGTPDGR